jgi:hypothetical protein
MEICSFFYELLLIAESPKAFLLFELFAIFLLISSGICCFFKHNELI